MSANSNPGNAKTDTVGKKHLNINLFSAYSSNYAATINFWNGKFYLNIIPKSPSTQDTKNGSTKKFGWNNRKTFKLERHEMYLIKDAVKIALNETHAMAKKYCQNILGEKNSNPMFSHKNPVNGFVTKGGVTFSENNDPNKPYQSGIFLQIVSYNTKSEENIGNTTDKEEFSCPLSKAVAKQFVADLELILDETIRSPLRHNISSMIDQQSEEEEEKKQYTDEV